MIYDVLGVGFGPSNIALDIAMEESGYSGDSIFLESRESVSWHGEMLLDGSDIQNNPLRDLITPVNPRSKYTFVNFIHQSGRFFKYLNLGLVHPLRKDYYQYIAWVAGQFDNVLYESEVLEIGLSTQGEEVLWRVVDCRGMDYFCRNLVVGTGRKINVPKVPGLNPEDAVHSTRYLNKISEFGKDASIVVVGGSQSAVEIVLDLLVKGYTNVVVIHRDFSFRMKDASPFSDEVYFPEYVDYYHGLSRENRRRLDAQTRQTNYSSVDRDVLERLYLTIYEDLIDGRKRVRVLRNAEICKVLGKQIVVRETMKDAEIVVPFDVIVLATGFLDVGRNGEEALPALLQPMASRFRWYNGYLDVARDYRVGAVDGNVPPIYFNGLCESSHGLGDAGSISLVSIRARDILRSIECC